MLSPQCAHNPSSFVGQHRMSPKPPDQLYSTIICPSVLYASFATYIYIFSVEQILSIEFFLAYRISFAIGAKTIRNQFCCILLLLLLLLLLLYCLYPCVLQSALEDLSFIIKNSSSQARAFRSRFVSIEIDIGKQQAQ